MTTTAFLLEGTSTLPNADGIAAQLQEEAEASSPQKDSALVSSQSEESQSIITSSNNNNFNLGKPLHSKPLEISFLNPRGKFHLTLHENGIAATTVTKPQPMIIAKGCVRNAVVFPKPQDCQSTTTKKGAAPPSPMMLLCFQEHGDDNKLPSFKQKPLSQVCFPVPASLGEDQLEEVTADNTSDDAVDAWIQLVSRSLGIHPKTQVYRVQNPVHPQKGTGWSFKSHQEAGVSTTQDAKPFVNCYRGVHDGSLYPMKEGLLFFK